MTRIDREQFNEPDVDGPVLYRCYGLDGTLMYIGQSRNLRRRILDHRRDKPWWFAVEYLLLQHYRNPKVLRQDELRAIFTERPFFNIHGKGRRAAIMGTGNGVPIFAQGNTYDEVRRAEKDVVVFPQFAS